MGTDLGGRRGPHMTERESVAVALDYSHKRVAMYQELADKELAEVTRLQAKLDSMKEGEE